MEKIIFIALGGAVGALCRVYIGEAILRKYGGFLPYGTIFVNLLGSLLIGICLGFYMLRPDLPEWAKFLLVAGGLGAFTTFSTFAYELLQLVVGGQYGDAFIYGGSQLVGGLLLCWLGIIIARALS